MLLNPILYIGAVGGGPGHSTPTQAIILSDNDELTEDYLLLSGAAQSGADLLLHSEEI